MTGEHTKLNELRFAGLQHGYSSKTRAPTPVRSTTRFGLLFNATALHSSSPSWLCTGSGAAHINLDTLRST